jgi:hypothetical protein
MSHYICKFANSTSVHFRYMEVSHAVIVCAIFGTQKSHYSLAYWIKSAASDLSCTKSLPFKFKQKCAIIHRLVGAFSLRYESQNNAVADTFSSHKTVTLGT